MPAAAIVTLTGSAPRFSFHARQRMAELRISRELVRQTLATPSTTWPGRRGCIEFVGPAIIVTADTSTATVVTVKLKTPVPYAHGVHHLHNRPA